MVTFKPSKDALSINVLKSEVFIWVEPRIARLTNLIIVVSKFSDKAIEKQFEKYVVTVPKIEGWMLKDYVYSITEGVAHKDLDWLMQLCGTNYARLQQELDKVSLFREDERRYLFDDLIRDGAVDDLSSYSIFNFTNAITSKDLTAIKSVYKELSRMDVNEFGLPFCYRCCLSLFIVENVWGMSRSLVWPRSSVRPIADKFCAM